MVVIIAITLAHGRHKRSMQFLTSVPNFMGSADPPPSDPALLSPWDIVSYDFLRILICSSLFARSGSRARSENEI